VTGGVEMAKLEASITINRPIEEVFAFTSNHENEFLWRTELLEMEQTSEGPIGVGTTYREVMQFLGRRIEATGEITKYEPNNMIAMRTTSGPLPFELTGTYQTVEGGTKLTFEVEAEVGGFFRFAEPLVARMGKRQMETQLANIKDLLEAQT
jgi:uncharacterized protein YndB with AHSA1/START domain